MSANLNMNAASLSARGESVGGKHPDPPLDGFPLLAWVPDHPIHGSEVITEDGAATVIDLVDTFRESSDVKLVASIHCTTPDHVQQALLYGVKAGHFKGG